MKLRYSSQARAERIVAVARALIAAVFFLAAYAGEGHAVDDAALPLFAVYLTVAVGILGVGYRGLLFRSWPLATHAIDVVFFGVNLFLDEPERAPLFVSFLFPIASASLLFRWKQALVTLVAMTAALVASAIYRVQIEDSSSYIDAVAVSGAGLVAIAALMLFDRSRNERLENEVAALSEWPISTENEIPTREILERVCETLGATRVILTWEEPDEPWLHVAWKFGNDFQWIREAPTKYDPLVVEQLRDVSFLSRDLASSSSVLFRGGGAFHEVTLEPLHGGFKRDFNLRNVLSLSLDGHTFQGRLFAIDRQELSADDLVFGEVVARFVTSRMDHAYLLQRAQQAAVGEERMKLSRDLHDGVLQSLTGAALQLEAVRGMLASEPDEARKRLADIQAVLQSDQRELRSFIRELRPATSSADSEHRLTQRLTTLTDRFKQQWGVRVNMQTNGMTHLISSALRHEIYSIVNEGVANAAKHAKARKVDVRIETSSDNVVIHVQDDGSGFPFRGRFTMRELNEMRRGPVTLKERVTSLNGDLVLDSTEHGSQLQITIPLNWMGS